MAVGFSKQIISLASATRELQKRAAEEQGGLLSGEDPTQFTSTDPFRLWVIQVGLIVMTAQILSLILKRLREPKVIAEVLGGILLGPTAFGRIPGFTQHIFPSESLPYLSLTANIGLVLFLFLVGLEIETNVIKRNARFSLPIALAGMAIPFGLGAALSLPIYDRYIDSDQTSYTHFMVFTGVAFSITAFPVLCRILTELKIVDTTVGIVVLSAGVGNDIVGWTLLALAVALVNASSGVSALYILLTVLAWTLFLLFPVKRAFRWLAQRTGSIENGPTMTFMTATMLLTFGSAFFTDAIGVQAILGGFLAGLVVPREGGLAISLTEKLEDMVSIIFLPLYFTLSGLSTNLGLLDDGITWGYTIAICCLAMFGKFGGCSIAARLFGFKWREASTIGALMSCKGLVELIVLNVGLQAGILTQRVFSMFVFEAVVLTCLTTPVVLLLYPPHKRTRATETGPDYRATSGEEGKLDLEGRSRKSKGLQYEEDEMEVWKTRFTVVLDKIEHLPGMMSLTQLICPPPYVEKPRDANGGTGMLESKGSEGSLLEDRGPKFTSSPSISVDALRLIELSDRTSAVMKSTSAASEHHLIQADPVLNVFRTFGELNGLDVSSSLSVVTFSDLARRVADRARDTGSHLILVPWLPPSHSPASSSRGPANEKEGVTLALPTPSAVTPLLNPFDTLFRTQSYSGDRPSARSSSIVHAQFVRSVFAQKWTDVALYVDVTSSSISSYPAEDDVSSQSRSEGEHACSSIRQHVFLPFFGGPDDRLALEFVVQLCANPNISATVIRITKSSASEIESSEEEEEEVAEEGGSGSSGAEVQKPEKARAKSDDDRMADEASAAAANIRANAISIQSTYGFPDTVYGAFTTQMRLHSETADNLTWARYASRSPDSSDPLPPRAADALTRITFRTDATPRPLHFIVDEILSLSYLPSPLPPASPGSRAQDLAGGGGEGAAGAVRKRKRKLVVVVGRSRRLAVEDHSAELKAMLEEQHGSTGGVGGEVRKTVGDVASAVIGRGCDASVVVMQAAHRKLEDE